MSTNDDIRHPIPADASRQPADTGLLTWLVQDTTATCPLPLIREDELARQPASADVLTASARPAGRRMRGREHHGARFLAFGAIGGAVFLAGLALQLVLVRDFHIDPVAAYIIQGIASVQLSFLLNRYVTWRDRSVRFWGALWRFNTQKALLTVINMGAYALLVRLGVQYLVANIGLTAAFTPVNYLLGHYWSFVARPRSAAAGEMRSKDKVKGYERYVKLPALIAGQLTDAMALLRRTGVKHGARFLTFGAIGGGVFLIGLVLQAALVRKLGWGAVPAYIAQTAVGIQLTYLFNRHSTWRDRKVKFWGACWKWNVQRIGLTIPNILLYTALVRYGLHYLMANAVATGVFTIVNYLAGHYWSLAAKKKAPEVADGMAVLFQIAEAQRQRRLDGSPTGSSGSSRSNGHCPVRAIGTALLPPKEAIRGALRPSYNVPEVTFNRKRGRGIALTVLLMAATIVWRIHSGIPLVIAFCVLPAAAVKGLSWMVSWFDKPATTTPRQQPLIDGLHVTVAIPCYNEDRFLLDRCLWALANQTRPPQLIWVVDDGSSEDYSELQRYWEKFLPGGIEVRWTKQQNQGKRRAHALVFEAVTDTDIFVTVDSDTTLALNALEEGLKPFSRPEVMSVAGIEHGFNAEINSLTRLQECLQLFAQAVIGATWSVFGDMYTNRGPFALYRCELIKRIYRLYADEVFFGRRVILGDDSLLALAGSTYGKSVQQLTAFGLTMWPETLGHHIRQRIRWARGRAMRNFWRIRYRPFLSFVWWYTVLGIYSFLVSTSLLLLFLWDWPADERTLGHTAVGLVVITIVISPRVLCIRKSSETFTDRLLLVFMRPLAGLWASIVLSRIVRFYGTVTVLRQGWTTRHRGPELVMIDTEIEVREKVLV